MNNITFYRHMFFPCTLCLVSIMFNQSTDQLVSHGWDVLYKSWDVAKWFPKYLDNKDNHQQLGPLSLPPCPLELLMNRQYEQKEQKLCGMHVIASRRYSYYHGWYSSVPSVLILLSIYLFCKVSLLTFNKDLQAIIIDNNFGLDGAWIISDKC